MNYEDWRRVYEHKMGEAKFHEEYLAEPYHDSRIRYETKKLYEKECSRLKVHLEELKMLNKELTAENFNLKKKNEELLKELDKIHNRFDILDL